MKNMTEFEINMMLAAGWHDIATNVLAPPSEAFAEARNWYFFGREAYFSAYMAQKA